MKDADSPRYRGFLRSGSYPALARRRAFDLGASPSTWLMLAVVASSAAYKLTQSVLPPAAATFPAPIAQAALPTCAGLLSAGRNSVDVYVGVQPTAAPGSRRVTRNPPPRLTRARMAVPVQTVAAQERAVALAVVSEPPTQLSAAREPNLALPVLGERTLTLALANELADAALRVPSAAPPAPVAREIDSPAPHPEASTAATITLSRVRGPLSAATIKHGVERVRGSLTSCHARARSAGEQPSREVQVLLGIDASGHARPRLEGGQSSALGACLRVALSKVVCPAPDTGDAQANLVLSFDP